MNADNRRHLRLQVKEMNNKVNSARRVVLFMFLSLVVSHSTAQLQDPAPQSTDFEVGRRPEAMVFDGSNVWVANQQGDSLMKLRARWPEHGHV